MTQFIFLLDNAALYPRILVHVDLLYSHLSSYYHCLMFSIWKKIKIEINFSMWALDDYIMIMSNIS